MLEMKIGLWVVGKAPVCGNAPGPVVVVVVVGNAVVDVGDGFERVVGPVWAVASGRPPVAARAITRAAPITKTQATSSAAIRRRRDAHRCDARRCERIEPNVDRVNARASINP
jgi:hypothetical protein